MPVDHDQIELQTEGHTDIINVTDQVESALQSSSIEEGIVCVFNPGSTGALTTIEYESGCVQDFEELLERLIPADRSYHHEAGLPDSNAHSHMRASLIGPSVSLPIRSGQLVHGTWQQIVFVDFDNRPRNRTLDVQMTGN
jgi:secondary thiamine-phosphate synthase enzyme